MPVLTALFVITSDGAPDELHVPDRFDAFGLTFEPAWGVQPDQLDVASVVWIDIPRVSR